MKRKTYFKILALIVTVVGLIFLFTLLFVRPWVEKKIRASLQNENSMYDVTIDKVNVSLFTLGIAVNSIAICTRQEKSGKGNVNLEITNLNVRGINPWKAIFKNEFDVNEVIVSDIHGVIPMSEDSIPSKVSSLHLQVDKILLDRINLKIENISTAEFYSVKDGVLHVYDFHVSKLDTLSFRNLGQLDFTAEELRSVSEDSMYTFTANGIICGANSNNLVVKNFSIHPNYKDYNFTSRYKFQTNCIDVELSNISIFDFSFSDYVKSRNLVSSYIEIGKMDLKVFRDKRKEFLHVSKPMFQELIYNYPHVINIDSIGVNSGNVTYIEHADKANHPGSISFNEINGKIYKISNDTIFKSEKAYLKLKSNARLMGKGKVTVLLKAQLFERLNTFSVEGTISGMEAKELNPMLEPNAFVYVSSGKLNKMSFSFMANNHKASGTMTIHYAELEIAIKNKQTDKTTALKERIVSWFANMKIIDSNPQGDKPVRVGIIDYERNPEKVVFNYCFKAMLTGIKSSITKSSKDK